MSKPSQSWWQRPGVRSAGRVLRVLFLSYFGFCLVLFALQRRMIYLPQVLTAEQNHRLARTLGMRAIENNGQFLGWAVGPEEADGVILIFHGNAGNAVHRDYFSYLFHNQTATENHALWIMEYPGYGHRGGRPSQASFFRAGEEFLQLARTQFSEVILVGESLGGGVASYLAGSFPEDVTAVLLITPFDRLNSIARYHYPWLPTGLFLLDRFPNDQHLAGFDGPVGIVVAENDAVIPVAASRRLYESFSGPKLFRLQEGADHNTLYFGPDLSFWEEMTAFLRAGLVSD